MLASTLLQTHNIKPIYKNTIVNQFNEVSGQFVKKNNT